MPLEETFRMWMCADGTPVSTWGARQKAQNTLLGSKRTGVLVTRYVV
jgi:hypothetical protein